MRLLVIFVGIVSSIYFTNVDGANILAYIPSASISHQLPFRLLFQEIARRGHELTVITTDPAYPKGEAPANYTEIDIHDLSYQIVAERAVNLSRGDKGGFINLMRDTVNIISAVMDAQLGAAEVRKAIFDSKYDLLLLEQFMEPALVLSHIHKVPVIHLSSLGGNPKGLEAMGVPTHPLLYSSFFRQRLYNRTMWDKIVELYNHYNYMKIFYDAEEPWNKILQKHFGKDVPPISELYNNVDMLFLNVHPIFEGNHPVPPSVIYVWGIHKKPQKELPEDLKTFLDSSKHGVIYMSFGSNTDPTHLPPEKIKKFVKVFCDLPYDVLWKWKGEELPDKCKNIKTSKWFPQPDLLRHPKVKLFVTQGGLQSTDEAITAGVPLVGIPMMGDQWYNVEKYVHFKIGVKLELDTLTEESFRNAVTTVIEDESYRRNIKKLNTLMRDEPQPALERAVWWIEHVLRHGGAKHLRAPGANISWWQYLELDLVLTLLTSVMVALLVVLFFIYYLYSLLRGRFASGVKLKTK